MSTLIARRQMDERRLLLSSTRIRFMPQAQPIRETAIDKILEQNLLLADEPLLLREIENQCLDLNGRPILSHVDIETSLWRLSARTVLVEGQRDRRYSLCEKRKQELWSAQDYAETRYKAIVNRLFRGAPSGVASYSQPFIECLSLIFSGLGEAYVRHIKHEISGSDLMNIANVTKAICDTKKYYPTIDEKVFASAIVRFFEETDPNYDELKWNLAQNYYVAKALGLDPSGVLLTKELFTNATFYIDTNVLVHSLDYTGKHYTSFKVLTQACKELGIRVLVARISIDEMRRVAALERELISKKVDERIPPELMSRLRGILLPAYLEQIRTEGNCDLDKLFEKFDKPSQYLKSLYGIEVVDDEWFLSAGDEVEVLKLVDEVKAAYYRAGGRKKSENAALHDALMIRWLEKERCSVNPDTWFVTLDMSLPTFKHDRQGQCRPYAVTLLGLMQWLSPVAITDLGEDEAAAIFSEALKHQLLPHETFFELRDFLVFSEMDMQTELLPAEDVEECIRKIKATAPDLDPTDARDREKLAHEISKYFVDPGRQYKASLQEHRQTIEQLTTDFDSQKQVTGAELKALKAEVTEKDAQIGKLNSKVKEAQLKWEAKLRLTLIAMGFVLSDIGMVYVVQEFGEGANLVQQLTKSWPLLASVFALWVIISWFAIGKDRLSALGFPYTKLLKEEPSFEELGKDD